MKENRKIFIVLLLLSTLISGAVITYYWVHESVEASRTLPMYVVGLIFGYVLVQMAKRQLFTRRNWWDWLYYLGLLSVVLPTFFMTTRNASLFHIVTDFGVFFLLIPVFLDGKQWMNEK